MIFRVFHGFGQAKFAYGGSILGSSQFTLLLQLPLKMMLCFIFYEISDGLRMLLIDGLQGRRQQCGHARQGGGGPAWRLLLDRGGGAFVGREAGLRRRWSAAGAGARGRIGLEQVRICQWRGGAAAGCHGWPEREVRVAICVHVWKNKANNILLTAVSDANIKELFSHLSGTCNWSHTYLILLKLPN